MRAKKKAKQMETSILKGEEAIETEKRNVECTPRIERT